MNLIKRSIIEQEIDILEDDILEINKTVMNLLLKDKTSHKNILWCTKDYEMYGEDYNEQKEIKIDLITGNFPNIIQPRAAKSKYIQEQRVRNRAEVFTPSWICNIQNNQIDDAWFSQSNVFNTPCNTSWITSNTKIKFPSFKKNWQAYVNAKRLEITCGEAPYIVSRYDTTTGETIPLYNRIGIFDRKMRIVNENCLDNDSWLKWSIKAIKSVYGFEFQGDSVLIARENLLYDYMDYYEDKFQEKTPVSLLKKIANIIAWNIWQMDGLKFVIPYSCHDIEQEERAISLFENTIINKTKPCPGCEKNYISKHTGIYCRIYDWSNLNKSILFIDMFKEKL